METTEVFAVLQMYLIIQRLWQKNKLYFNYTCIYVHVQMGDIFPPLLPRISDFGNLGGTAEM
jgi:hypothetical protein